MGTASVPHGLATETKMDVSGHLEDAKVDILRLVPNQEKPNRQLATRPNYYESKQSASSEEESAVPRREPLPLMHARGELKRDVPPKRELRTSNASDASHESEDVNKLQTSEFWHMLYGQGSSSRRLS
eukprot:CAMPEP_0172539530 /NCGR_PEP_ID=MMETSP1067-20121228/10726_1 /TAXON_ID=265564 ORGANISM="Thalassiosira punctigera, Strain Tpunct2005C2" /NCGR_SAMPLE_ID=MMETSP1067 /ASSEMBLY_ACC=CAM_ASM_000444 /LENGTH=127 /DNA_ID=CAMNT_0013325229 /DNA_START=32 /DNA_END=412 /DNA_ORIENTATION=+